MSLCVSSAVSAVNYDEPQRPRKAAEIRKGSVVFENPICSKDTAIHGEETS